LWFVDGLLLLIRAHTHIAAHNTHRNLEMRTQPPLLKALLLCRAVLHWAGDTWTLAGCLAGWLAGWRLWLSAQQQHSNAKARAVLWSGLLYD
jgi:hypothetical protein